jgi:hypothetical protein
MRSERKKWGRFLRERPRLSQLDGDILLMSRKTERMANPYYSRVQRMKIRAGQVSRRDGLLDWEFLLWV